MTRGILNESDLAEITQCLPNFDTIRDLKEKIPGPLGLSIISPYESYFPVAYVCFNDSYDALWSAHHALFEMNAHKLWYMKKNIPANETAAALFGKFYGNYSILSLYATSEHLANGIIMMLELHDEFVRYNSSKTKSSQQILVGKYLHENLPIHPITNAVTKLKDTIEWQEILRYRDRWIHEQPPTVQQLGIAYKRKRLWEKIQSENGYRYHMKVSNSFYSPEYSIDDLAFLISKGISAFSETFIAVVEYYIKTAESNRLDFNSKSNHHIEFGKSAELE